MLLILAYFLQSGKKNELLERSLAAIPPYSN